MKRERQWVRMALACAWLALASCGQSSGDDGGGYAGADGACSPGQTLCNGACTDTLTDPANCGFCGNVCGGSACNDGQCSVAGTGGVGTGGAVGTGGFVGTGGDIGIGGFVGTGGDVGIGGFVGTGGDVGIGGFVGAGGDIGTGGELGLGGAGIGGSGTGGDGAGGDPGSGGSGTGGTGTGGEWAAFGGTGTGGEWAAFGGTGTGGDGTGGDGTGGDGTGGDGTGGDGTGGASGEPVFHVFLLLGQSNMAGYAQAQPADKVEDDRIQVLGFDDCAATGRQTDQWDVAVPPLHECWNGALGPGDYFSKTLVDSIPAGDTIGLVPCAISGERIETFMKVGGTQYDWIIGRAQLAQQAGGVIEGLLFHQGESNCGDSSWPGKVNTLVEDLRTDLGLGSAPFLAGELPYDGDCSNHNTLVNQLPSVVTNAYVVSASGLTVDPADTQWNLHFGHDSTLTLGVRYAETMIQALGW